MTNNSNEPEEIDIDIMPQDGDFESVLTESKILEKNEFGNQQIKMNDIQVNLDTKLQPNYNQNPIVTNPNPNPNVNNNYQNKPNQFQYQSNNPNLVNNIPMNNQMNNNSIIIPNQVNNNVMNPNNMNINPNNNMMNMNSINNKNVVPNNFGNFSQNFMPQDIYQSNYYGNLNDIPSKIQNVQNTYGAFDPGYSGLNNTQVFMQKAVDVTCEDHRDRSLGVIEATRYCSECLKIVCDSCVIEYHGEHFDKARKKIDTYFSEQKKELEDLIIENKYRIEQKQYLTDIENRKNKLSEEIKRFFSNRTATYQTLKDKIEDLSREENELKNRILQAIEVFYKDECYTRLDYPIRQLNSSKFLI